MLEMVRAHGLDAGPTQRPWLAGAVSGMLADLIALPLLGAFGSLAAVADAIHVSRASVAVQHAGAMMMAGIGYGMVFRRGANDVPGGALFGIAYGFLLWMIVVVPLLQWLPPRPLMMELPATGVFLGQLLWGLIMGASLKVVHRPMQSGIDGDLPAWPGTVSRRSSAVRRSR